MRITMVPAVLTSLLVAGCVQPYLSVAQRRDIMQASVAADEARRIFLLHPSDSADQATSLWLAAAVYYNNAGQIDLASAMLQNASIATLESGHVDRALAYSALGASYGRVSGGQSGGVLADVVYASRTVAAAPVPHGLGSGAARYAIHGPRDSALAYFGTALTFSGQLNAAAVIALLEQNPLLDSAATDTAAAYFIKAGEQLLDEVPKIGVLVQPAETIQEVTRDLEDLLGQARVTAVVTSQPPSIVVRYWRLVGDPAQARDVTTTDTLLVRPAAYVFEATHPQTGIRATQRKNCITSCTVTFNFTAAPQR